MVQFIEGDGVDSTLNDAAACAETSIDKQEVSGVVDVGIYGDAPTEITFEINYSGPPTLIVDKVPAEFGVIDCAEDDDGSVCHFFLDSNAKGPKAKANSATVIEWTISDAGSHTLTVEIETRESSGNKKTVVYKPTSCGDLPLNLGAVAYQVDANGDLVLDSGNPIPLVASNIPVVQAIAGTKPCAPERVTVTFVPTDTLSLDWDDNAETVHHYNVYRGTSPDGPFTLIAMPTSSDYDDVGLSPDEYCYQVKAAFGPGDEDEGNESGTVCGIVPAT